jgi:hypothetical protein
LDGKEALHFDFQLIIAKEGGYEEEVEESDDDEPIASKIDTAQSASRYAGPSKKNSPKRTRKKKIKRNYRISTHCGGQQKTSGHNAETSSPDIGNPIIEVHTNRWRTTFKYRDGSMAPLSLELYSWEKVNVFKVPVGQVAQVILHYESKYNRLWGISMVDRKGNTLFKTCDDEDADASHTISLQEGESIVGFRSYAADIGREASHQDFQLIIAKEVEVEEEIEESDEE